MGNKDRYLKEERKSELEGEEEREREVGGWGRERGIKHESKNKEIECEIEKYSVAER